MSFISWFTRLTGNYPSPPLDFCSRSRRSGLILIKLAEACSWLARLAKVSSKASEQHYALSSATAKVRIPKAAKKLSSSPLIWFELNSNSGCGNHESSMDIRMRETIKGADYYYYY